MSVYCLVAELRRLLAPTTLALPAPPLGWLRATVLLSLTIYLTIKVIDVVVGVSHTSMLELTLVPAAVAGLALAFLSRRGRRGDESAASASDVPDVGDDAVGQKVRWSWLAAALLLVFTVVFVVVNTVPSTFSPDESAIVYGGRQLMTEGSLRVTNSLNSRYDTNIIGNLHVSYQSPEEMYYRVFPGTALLYAPFSLMPGDSGFLAFPALFGAIAIGSLYVVARKLLRSWWAAAVAGLLFASSPVFAHWGVTVFNNVPVLALELAALALILSASGERLRLLGVAGALMGLAVFVRVTELVFVLPMLGLVWWRTRALRPSAAFIVPAVGGVAAFLIANAVLFGNPLFVPQVGDSYLLPAATTGSEKSLAEAYLRFATGTQGSVSDFDPVEKLGNVLFHLRYLGSSTFAFPFLAIGFAGLVWRIAAGRRDGWLLGVAVVVAVAAVILLYGHKRDNYFGFGEPIVRSSFVRYSLLVYALLAVAGGAFFLEAARRFRGEAARVVLLGAALAAVLAVGIGQSYDREVFGLNRLNMNRTSDRNAWETIDSYLQDRPESPLLIVGSHSMKLIDLVDYPDAANYDAVPPFYRLGMLWQPAFLALAEREVFLVVSQFETGERRMVEGAAEYFTVHRALSAPPWAVYSLGVMTDTGPCVSCK